jgi:hypothetical protein
VSCLLLPNCDTELTYGQTACYPDAHFLTLTILSYPMAPVTPLTLNSVTPLKARRIQEAPWTMHPATDPELCHTPEGAAHPGGVDQRSQMGPQNP